MTLTPSQTKILIKALKTYRDKQISMRIDPLSTNELLRQVKRESQEEPVKLEDQIHPQTGEQL
jgi:hypothetical protein